MVADTGQVVEHDSLDLGHLLLHFGSHVLEIGIVGGVDIRTGQIVVPVRTGLDIHGITGNS